VKKKIIIPVLSFFILTFIACEEIDIARMVGATTKVAEAARPLTEEEEYYVGRAVAARILGTYPLLEDNEKTKYVNLVGQTVALHSDKPVTYGGYHYAILDTDEINAFACPGGTIFITRGVLETVENEDELAAVLAHEVAHINHRDGVSAIQTSRLTGLATVLASETAASLGSENLAKLVSIFEGSINDVFTKLVVNGYGKQQESQADVSALTYLSRAGYDPESLKNYLERIIIAGQESGGGVMSTHPATASRVENVEKYLPGEGSDITLVLLRKDRFQDSTR
jgi:predicted Zn-dependent protease